jgi:hypothetical protein
MFERKPKSVTLAFKHYFGEAGFGELTFLIFGYRYHFHTIFHYCFAFERKPKSVTVAIKR